MLQPFRWIKLLSTIALALSIFLAFSGLALAQNTTVTATDPVANAVAVPLTQTLAITFNQTINAATVNSGSMVVQGMLGGRVTGTYSVNGAQVTITPTRPFFPNELVRTTVTSGMQAQSGNASVPYQWQFSAGEVRERCLTGFRVINAGLPGVYGSGVAWGDYDNDGDLDILLTGRDSNNAGHTYIYRNHNGAFTDINAGLTGVGAGSVAWGDYDNDGDLDILLAGFLDNNTPIYRIYRYHNGAFTDISAGLTGVGVGSVAWGDYDNDGDLDILLTGSDSNNAGHTNIYRNNNGVFANIGAGLTGVYYSSAAWGDYDNDGDLDILLTGLMRTGLYTNGPVSQIYRNDNGVFSNIDTGLTGVYNSSVAWGDYDNDGDLDILITGSTGSTRIANVYRNDNGAFSNINAGLAGVDDSSVAWGDYDNDGDLDILLAGATNNFNARTSQVYRNDNGSFSNINAGLTEVYNSSVAWGDVDNDGDLDILLAGVSTSGPVSQLYRNGDCPVAKAGTDQTVSVNAPLTLNGAASLDLNGGLLSYGWRTNNAPSLSFSRNLSITTFSAPAAPTILTFTLTITTSEGYTATDSTVVTVTEIAISALQATNNNPTQLGNATRLSATLSSGSNVSYSWNFGDSNSGSGAQVNHTYANVDSYTATVTASNSVSSFSTTTLVTIIDVPLAHAQALTLTEDTSLAITLTASDGDGSLLSFQWVDLPQNGSLTGIAPNLRYTPTANFNGSDSFTFRASDGQFDSDLATVTITVAPVNDTPLAYAQALTLAEDTPIWITLTGSDLDLNVLSFSIVQSPSHGSLTGIAPNLRYTPTANFHGSDSFTFRANDGNADSALATVTITITSVNDTPVANAQSLIVAEDTPIWITLTGSDLDLDGISFTIVNTPSHGSLTGIAPNLVYTPTANFNGSDSFTFRANDGNVNSALATVTITVAGVNDTPLAYAQALTVAEDTPLLITLTGSDLDLNVLSFSIVQSPSHGSLTGIAPNLRYTPTANFNGSDSFTFRVNDGNVDSALATVTITVAAVNDTPVAYAQALTLAEDTPISITLTGSDLDLDMLSFTIVNTPSHGTLTGIAPNLRYTPTANFNGSDSFTFRVNDGNVDSALATMTITVSAVNDTPLAYAQALTVAEDTPLLITLSGSDLDLNVLGFSIVQSPSHGSLTGVAPNLRYTPTANFNGSDSFTFRANDGNVDSALATVTITVTPVNDTPVAYAQALTVAEDTPISITLTGSDLDLDELDFSFFGSPLHGTLSGVAPNLRYTPMANFNGVDHFRFSVNDGDIYFILATVTITVTPVNDTPLAYAQALTVAEDTPLSITLTGSDLDLNVLGFSIVESPLHGSLTGVAPNLRYTPTANFNGVDSFTFQSNDGQFDSALATVTITVAPVNDTPLAYAQALTVAEDTPLLITLTGSDLDLDGISFTIVQPPSHGSLTGIAPNLRYTPTANFNGSDSFTFRANDGNVNSALATVTITVTPVNDTPLVYAQALTLTEDTPLLITLTGSDLDLNVLSFSIVDAPSHGSLTGIAPNLRYTPTANFNGSDSFTFRANDGNVNSALATVTITVTPVNDTPLVYAQALTLTEDTPISITLTGSDLDLDDLDFSIVDAPSHGNLTGVAPNLRYTPTANFNGSDSFTFRTSDGQFDSDLATVEITVSAVNDTPLAHTQALTVAEDTPLAIMLTGSDLDLDELDFTIVESPLHGNLTGVAPNLRYTPTANFNGSDSFTFRVNDGNVDSTLATVTISVTPINDTPLAHAQALTLTEDTPLSITLTGSDLDLDDLDFSIVDAPSHGNLTGVAPNLRYTPTTNFNGSDSFTFQSSDGQLDSDLATVEITVSSVNDTPLAHAQALTLTEDTPLAIMLTGSDLDLDELDFTIVESPLHGNLTGVAPNLRYTPTANFNGSDSFTFRVNDGNVDSTLATVTISVTPINDTPLAHAQALTLTEDTPLSITLTGSDLDLDDLDFSIVEAPLHGNLTGVAPNLRYTPTTNFNGSDSFTFQSNDGQFDSDLATVTITIAAVNDTPLAYAQSLTLTEDTPLSITLTGSDLDLDDLDFSIVEAPLHGTLTGVAPNLRYTPTANFNGSDSFTFQSNDGQFDSDLATVTITIAAVNDTPLAYAQSLTVAEDTPISIILTGSDLDLDGISFTIVESPLHGNLTGVAPNLRYTPTANFNGSDSFTFQSNDGQFDSDLATVTITIAAVNDTPLAYAQSLTVAEDTPISIILTGSDLDLDGISFTIVESPLHGTLTGVAPNLRYTPTANFNGSDSFTFQSNDGQFDSDLATVEITIAAVNDTPLAHAQALTVTEDTPLSITLTGSDLDLDELSFTIVNAPLHGNLTGVAPNLRYTPTANFNGSDSFTFQSNDGQFDSDLATVTITIAAVNDTPLAYAQSLTLTEDTPLSITLTGSDLDLDDLDFSIVETPSHGTLTGVAPNLHYTPTANFNGVDHFRFDANDGNVDSALATVTITVTAVNDTPVAYVQAFTLAEDTPLSITLTGSDLDLDDLDFSIVDAPLHGTLTGIAPNLRYTPTANFHGVDHFTFHANDGKANSALATVTLTSLPVDDALVVVVPLITTNEDAAITITLPISDVDGDILTYVVTTPPLHGTVTGVSPNFIYTPNANFHGQDSVTFSASDGENSGANASSVNTTTSVTVTFQVADVNDAPLANSQTITITNEDQVDLTLFATDADGDSLSYRVIEQPAHGQLSGSAPSLIYTTDANFSGTDRVTFVVNDGQVDSTLGSMIIVVARPTGLDEEREPARSYSIFLPVVSR